MTEADLASDGILVAGLAAAFPDDGRLSEESGYSPGRSGRTWVLDPLDGTEGFIEGASGYAVHVGLLHAGRPVVGVVYEPRTDRLYYAATDQGAWLEEPGSEARQVHVSTRDVASDMPMISSSTLPGDTRERLLGTVGLADGGTIRSVGAKVGAMVRHAADVYVSAHPVCYWDSCAPLVVLEEAGGKLTLADGTPFQFALDSGPLARATRQQFQHGGPFLATNGTVHAQLLSAVSELLAW